MEHETSATAQAVDASLSVPVVAFCRTGRRSGPLYAMGQALGEPQ
jgi:protein tyrosine phosphatase (PTP) superfamily phosphohydrolase (DUF442 family)